VTKATSQTINSLAELRSEALAWGRKPRRFGGLYVTEHMVRSLRAYGWTIVFSAFTQPIVYLFGLALGLAALLDAPIEYGDMQVSYLVFVGPALLASATIAVATEEFSYPVMSGFKWRGHFYGFNASPIAPGQIVTGLVNTATARMMFVAIVYMGALYAFGAVPNLAWGWTAVLVAGLSGLAFGAMFMAYAASIEDDRGQFALVQRFIFTPMFLFSGTFYPLAVLPMWLQWLGWISPLWHAAELSRVLTFGHEIAPFMIVVHVGYLLLLSVAGILIARRLFARRLNK
jgi:lipooligosaccharide transport system permease protein